jgi:hypothetical protein
MNVWRLRQNRTKKSRTDTFFLVQLMYEYVMEEAIANDGRTD